MREALHSDRELAPAALAPPAVRSLALAEFRNYPVLRLELDARPVVLTGVNGAGKTNLLEAVSLLAPGRGLRRARLQEIDRHGASPEARWRVRAVVDTAAGIVEIETGREGEAGEPGAKRGLRIDRKTVRSQAELARLLAIQWVTPDMDRLFQDRSSARRRFLDRLVGGLDPDHGERIVAYDHALRERALLLRDGPRDPSWLASLEARMGEHGVAIAAARRAHLRLLSAALISGAGPFPRAEATVEGAIETWLDEAPALAVEERFKQALASSRTGDAESGGAGIGPHRSDLAVRHVATGQPAALCSTGEQKALLLALVLAEARIEAAERGSAPLLLLDEAGAHLDRVRRLALHEEIKSLGAQAWLTGTEDSLFEGLAGGAAQFLRVAGGSVVLRA